MGKGLYLNKYLMKMLVFLMILQFVILCTFGIYSISNIRERERASLNHILMLYERDLTEGLELMDRGLESIVSKKSVLQILKNTSELQRWHASRELLATMQDNLKDNRYADAYIIIENVFQKYLMVRSERVPYEGIESARKFFLDRFSSDTSDSGWFCAQLDTGTYLIHYYKYANVIVGAMISESTVKRLIGSGENEALAFGLYDKENNLCITEKQDHINRWGQRWGKVLKEEIPVYDGSYTLWGMNSSVSWIGEGGSLPFSLLAAAFAMILISFGFMQSFRRFVKKEIVVPLGELVTVSDAVKNGRWEAKLNLRCRNREFLELQEIYNTMLSTILKLTVEKYERIILLKDSELKYLHMQLRPHFFLNVLSTVHSLSYQHKEEEIRTFVKALSANIRYMFRTGLHTVPLREELTDLENYLEIQRLLYEDCFYVYMDVPKESESWPIPQMMLHTFMENVFKHVVGKFSFTSIFLKCRKMVWNEEEVLQIVMENSGKGFPDDVIKRVMEEKEESLDASKGVGLGSIKLILKYLYGRTDILYLENGPSGEARIIVYIPCPR